MRTILEKDNTILREQAEPVHESEFKAHWLLQLAQDLIAIMKEKCAVGVAAPQIGVSKRVIVFGTAYTKRQNLETHIPDTVLINPALRILSEEVESGYEGCLNTGELMAHVPRATEIEYTGFDLDGNAITKRATGFEARIVQHEIDHLNGILFFDRVVDTETITTRTELLKRL
ncbi:MAG TPA: peptide deformylase [Legionella sp.]|nr:peptide deformylase [Legionella sp.]